MLILGTDGVAGREMVQARESCDPTPIPPGALATIGRNPVHGRGIGQPPLALNSLRSETVSPRKPSTSVPQEAAQCAKPQACSSAPPMLRTNGVLEPRSHRMVDSLDGHDFLNLSFA